MRTIAQSTFKIVDWGRLATMMLANDVCTNLGGCTTNSYYSVDLTMLSLFKNCAALAQFNIILALR